MANNTNIQFYKDTRIVFETPNGEGKTAIGSADATVQGFEIEYNLGVTGANEAFKISPLGINYTLGPTGATGSINYTTLLPRIAQVGSLLQSLETPPDATTLQVDKRILLTDGVSTGSIEISGVDTEIACSGNLILEPVTGIVDLSGNTLDMGSGEIHQCNLIHSLINNDITMEALGIGDVILKTNNVNRLTISDTGTLTFQGGMTYDNVTNTLTATNFNGLVSNATNCVNAERVLVTTDNTNGDYYPTFVKTTGSNNKPFFIDTTSPMTYNPSTGVMSFPVPPICTTSATSANQLVNFQNFASAALSPTPILVSSGGGTATYNAATTIGRVVRLNNVCIFQLELQATNIASLNAGTLTIPLPFTNSACPASFAVGQIVGLAAAGAAEITASADPSSNSIFLGIRRTVASTATVALEKADITNTFRIRIGGSYFV
jgi:hypothetical protein